MLWGAVAYIVIYVEPESIRDIGIEGMYLPFVAIVTIAIWYTVMMVAQSWMFSLTVSALLGLTLTLSILRLMSWFTLLIISLLIGFSLYLHKRRDSVIESARQPK